MAAYLKSCLIALCLWMAAASGRPQQPPQPLQYILLVPPQAQQSANSEGLNPPSPKARDFWGESQFQDASKVAQGFSTQAQEFPAQAQQVFAQAQKASPPQDIYRVSQQSQAPLNEFPAPAQQYVAQAQELFGQAQNASPQQAFSYRVRRQYQPLGQTTFQTPLSGLNEFTAPVQQYVAQAQELFGQAQNALPQQAFSSRVRRQYQPLGQTTFQTQPARVNTQVFAPQPNSDLLPPRTSQPWNSFNNGNI